MKKLIAIFALVLAFTATQAQVKYPFGAATFSTLTVNNDTLTPSISNSLTYLTTSDTLIANTVIYATISSSVKAGADLYLRSLNGATVRTITFKSTYFQSPVITQVANKTKLIHFIYDGSKFVYVSSFQID